MSDHDIKRTYCRGQADLVVSQRRLQNSSRRFSLRRSTASDRVASDRPKTTDVSEIALEVAGGSAWVSNSAKSSVLSKAALRS